MSGLAGLITADCIALDVSATTWEEAVLAAGGLLEQADIAGPAYTGSMIDNVETNGPYIVVAPGFAFAHARPSPAVHRTGIVRSRVATAVALEQAGYRVTVVSLQRLGILPRELPPSIRLIRMAWWWPWLPGERLPSMVVCGTTARERFFAQLLRLNLTTRTRINRGDGAGVDVGTTGTVTW